MKIGIIIGRIGGVDGVALETEKWISVLKKMGHDVFVISGEFEGAARAHQDFETHFPLLSFFSPECEWEQNKAFYNPDKDPDALHSDIERISEFIARRINKWIKKNKIKVLISQNASALPSHLSMGLGIKKVVQSSGIPTITHDHDFHWERGTRYESVHKSINRFVNETFPLRLPEVKNVVINSYNQKRFKEKLNIQSIMVPNVMDFTKPYGLLNKQNKYFLKDLGIRKKDIPLFQITRIVRRKGIDTAIRLVHKLDNKRIKLVITGNHKDEEDKDYFNSLIDLIHDLQLINQVFFVDKMILDHRDLSDAYAHAKACTYFSTYEGFGNGFVECALARKPIFVNNYEPVYWEDIGNKGFQTVMLEDSNLSDDKLKEIESIIYDDARCKEIGEFNYELAQRHFSMVVLEEKLGGILSDIF